MLVACAAAGSSANTLSNYFAQDDIPLVVEDWRAQHLDQVKAILTQAYWPAPYSRLLYRPFTSILISLEWKMGGGAPFSFKVVQVALYAASAIAVLILALELLPFWGALAAALFFAVHPVHVEAVALAVNQAEVIVGLISALAVAWYIARRREGLPGWSGAVGLGLATFVAAHFKETGLMLFGLLLAAEVLVIKDTAPGRWRLTRPVWLVQLLAVVLAVAIRSLIPMETTSGTFKAEAFYQSTALSRLETMLVVVPEWLRLHLWPATLQADYSPRVIDQATSWGGAQWLGLAIVIMILLLAFRLRSRAPVIAFGVAWVAIGLFPVSNVLIPTGITMAERTLFLSSIGAMLAVAAFGTEAIRTTAGRRKVVLQGVMGTGVIVIAALGASRSASRHRIWRSSLSMWSQTLVDAPDSYRAWVAFGTLVYRLESPERGIDAYRVALQLYDKSEGPILQLAEWYRQRSDCPEAIPLYRQVLTLRDFAPAMASVTGCLVWEGDYRGAKEMALRGLKTGYYSTVFHLWFRTALEAERAHAPMHTVRFPKGYGYLFDKPTPNAGVIQWGGRLLP